MSNDRQDQITAAADEDHRALARFYECADDGQDVDVKRPMLDRLTALGWIDKIGRGRWQISGEGMSVLAEMEVL